MGHLQLQGVWSTIYIDDLLSVTDSFEKVLVQDRLIQETFMRGVGVFIPAKSSRIKHRLSFYEIYCV